MEMKKKETKSIVKEKKSRNVIFKKEKTVNWSE
jgi:hypothetical protein